MSARTVQMQRRDFYSFSWRLLLPAVLIGAFILLMYGSCVGCFMFMANAGGERGRRGQTNQQDYDRVQDTHRD